MIYDLLANSRRYHWPPHWETAVAAVEKMLAETMAGNPPKAGKYPVDGDDVYAVVGEYEPKDASTAKLESHRVYADLQAILLGIETGVAIPSCDALAVDKPYDPEKDAEFYHKPAEYPALFTLRPGIFALFPPGEAHMTQLGVEGAKSPIVKVVVKIRSR